MTPYRHDKEGIAILERMLRMRRFEEEVVALGEEKLIVGNFHLYIGQEAAGAAVLEVLAGQDQLVTHHRNHGHVVGRGAGLEECFAEIMGRAGGILGGRGGSTHLCAPALGVLPTSAILGGNVSLALGAAFSASRSGTGRIVAAFIGDASLEEGVFFEVLNIAALHKLPLLVVLENNNDGAVAVHQGGVSSATTAIADYLSIPRLFGIEATAVADGSDPIAVHEAAQRAAEGCRAGRGPAFIEVRTRRWPGSNLPYPKLVTGPTDLKMAWDAPPSGEHLDWVLQSDPVIRMARALDHELGREALLKLDRTVRSEAGAAAARARLSEFPQSESAFEHVFARTRAQ